MAKATTGQRFPDFFGRFDTDDIRSEFVKKPLEAGREEGFATAAETLDFLSTLPAALVAARERELQRLLRSGDKDSPRVQEVRASLEHAGRISALTELARARADRAVKIFTSDEVMFHGFVADRGLSPLKGLTVRLVTPDGGRYGSELSSKTMADGYFRIPLSKKSRASRHVKRKRGRTDRAEPAPTDPKGSVTVEILDRSDHVVHRDPDLLVLDTSRSTYREYVLREAR